MGTVNLSIAQLIKDQDGYFEDDPRVHRIVEYTDMGGRQAFGLEYEHSVGKYAKSPFIRNPKIFFQVK